MHRALIEQLHRARFRHEHVIGTELTVQVAERVQVAQRATQRDRELERCVLVGMRAQPLRENLAFGQRKYDIRPFARRRDVHFARQTRAMQARELQCFLLEAGARVHGLRERRWRNLYKAWLISEQASVDDAAVDRKSTRLNS